MDITLEQIELVKDRTGVSYKEAKEALEYSEGNVVDAIIYIEDSIDASYTPKEDSKIAEIVALIKDTIRKGNVSKIRIYNGDEIMLNIPVSVGLVGTVLFPWGTVLAALAAGFTKCKIEIINEDGSVVDISEKAGVALEVVKDKGSVIVDEVKDKSEDFYEVAKEKGLDFYEAAKEKGADFYEVAKEKGSDFYESAKGKGLDMYSVAKDRGADLYSNAKEKVSSFTQSFKNDRIDATEIYIKEEKDDK